MPQLSILICSYNRAQLTQLVLEDLQTQFRDFQHKDDIEIIFIDNNSKDNTKEVVMSFQNTLALKYFMEARQGIGFARNRAEQEASGKLLAYLDDDIRLANDWLEQTYAIAKTITDSQVICYGARVISQWDLPIPSWVKLEGAFAISQSVFPGHDYGKQQQTYPFTYKGIKVHNPLGACMLFTKNIFNQYAGFREDLGVGTADGSYLHEDTEFFRYLINNHVSMLYAPQVQVFHPVPEARMTQEYALSWYYRSALSFYFLLHNPRPGYWGDEAPTTLFIGVPEKLKKFMPSFMESIRLFNIPIYLIVKLLTLILLYPLSLMSFNEQFVFYYKVIIKKCQGEIRAAQLIKDQRYEK